MFLNTVLVSLKWFHSNQVKGGKQPCTNIAPHYETLRLGGTFKGTYFRVGSKSLIFSKDFNNWPLFEAVNSDNMAV